MAKLLTFISALALLAACETTQTTTPTPKPTTKSTSKPAAKATKKPEATAEATPASTWQSYRPQTGSNL